MRPPCTVGPRPNAISGQYSFMKGIASPEHGKISKRPADLRGKTELGWLHSRHTFSFGEYFDPDHMGYRSLRVLNDDVVEPGRGFGTHPHQDAEIFTYVIEGELQHRDSMGHGSIIKAGNLQYMSAGDGVLHSENNPSPEHRVHFLQIWLRPNHLGGEPLYAEKPLGNAAPRNALTLLFSGEKEEGVVQIRQDAEIYFGRLDNGHSVQLHTNPDHGIWIHLFRGELDLLGEPLKAGDGAAIEGRSELPIHALSDAEFLAFVLA